MTNKRSFMGRIKEGFRKFIVSLKIRTQLIPLTMMMLAFLIYAFNLTPISSTTFYISKPLMGLSSFLTFLLSILSFVCLLNAFPRRQPQNKLMLVLLYVMLTIILAADIAYLVRITQRLLDTANAISSVYVKAVMKTRVVIIIHGCFTAINIALLAFLPIYSRLIKKINTSVEVEDNGEINNIDVEMAD